MSIESDVETVDKSFIDICHPEAVIDAWYSIKLFLNKKEKHCATCKNVDTSTLDCKINNCKYERVESWR